MSVLSDKTIREYLDNDKIKIRPLKGKDIQPASIDLRLGNKFMMFRHEKGHIDPRNDEIRDYMRMITVEEEGAFIIQPHSVILATTKEYVKIPDDLIARVEGRSSIGRLGLTMHITAGYIDSGFEGKITLEIANLTSNAIKLYPNQRVCQIVFETMTTPSEIPYGHPSRDSKYMGQMKPECSKIDEDYDILGIK